MKKQLKIEGTISPVIAQLIVNAISNKSTSIDADLNSINQAVKGMKTGRGGSHIWVSNPDNQRVAIIHYK